MDTARKILRTITKGRLERDLTCEACGGEFKCGASLAGCWCAEIQLDDTTRAEFRARYSDCLCRNCLIEASQKQAERRT